MIGVSSDSVATHDRWAYDECLPFPLLADVEGEVRELYRVPRSLFGLLPGRVTFVIDRDRVIRRVFSSQWRLQRHIAVARQALIDILTAPTQASRAA